jgi:hypothetical protein
MPSRRQSSAMLSSPRSPSSTLRIFSSAEKCRRVARRMSLTASSAGCFSGPDFCLIFAPCGYDDPEILPPENRALAQRPRWRTSGWLEAGEEGGPRFRARLSESLASAPQIARRSARSRTPSLFPKDANPPLPDLRQNRQSLPPLPGAQPLDPAQPVGKFPHVQPRVPSLLTPNRNTTYQKLTR